MLTLVTQNSRLPCTGALSGYRMAWFRLPALLGARRALPSHAATVDVEYLRVGDRYEN
jgi:hypothetical protein